MSLLLAKLVAAAAVPIGLAAILTGCGGREAVPTPTPTPPAAVSRQMIIDSFIEMGGQYGVGAEDVVNRITTYERKYGGSLDALVDRDSYKHVDGCEILPEACSPVMDKLKDLRLKNHQSETGGS